MLLLAAGLLYAFYRQPMREAWRLAADADRRLDAPGRSIAGPTSGRAAENDLRRVVQLEHVLDLALAFAVDRCGSVVRKGSAVDRPGAAGHLDKHPAISPIRPFWPSSDLPQPPVGVNAGAAMRPDLTCDFPGHEALVALDDSSGEPTN